MANQLMKDIPTIEASKSDRDGIYIYVYTHIYIIIFNMVNENRSPGSSGIANV